MRTLAIRFPGRLQRGIGPVLVACGLLLLTACDIDFLEQDILVRYAEQADRLDVLLIYRGLTASGAGKADVEKAVAVVRRGLARRRQFMILDWPLLWDLDDQDEIPPAGSPAHWFRTHVSLADVGLQVDSRGRLCGYQALRIEQASVALQMLNDALSKAVLEAHARGRLDAELAWLDPEARNACLEQAGQGRPWLRIAEGRFLLDVPLPGSEAARKLVQRSRKKDEWGLRSLLEQCTGILQLSRDRVVLQLGEWHAGATTFRLVKPKTVYLAGLHETLVERRLLGKGPPVPGRIPR